MSPRLGVCFAFSVRLMSTLPLQSTPSRLLLSFGAESESQTQRAAAGAGGCCCSLESLLDDCSYTCDVKGRHSSPSVTVNGDVFFFCFNFMLFMALHLVLATTKLIQQYCTRSKVRSVPMRNKKQCMCFLVVEWHTYLMNEKSVLMNPWSSESAW